MSLADLIEDIRSCQACAGEFTHEPRPVLRVSNETRLLICGQAPGRLVHLSGQPFTDPSGDRLREWMGVDAATFYGDPRIGVAAMAFCYPGTQANGADFPPPPRCAALWRRRLLDHLPKVRTTLLVGGAAQTWALGEAADMGVTETVRNWRRWAPRAFVLPHPSWRNTAWLRRNPWFETDVVPELRRAVARLLA